MPYRFPSVRRFLADEAGAVTVDMVPLMAATVALGLAVMGIVSGGIENAADGISTTMEGDVIIQTAFPAPPDPPAPQVQGTDRGGTGIIRISGRVN
jgi:Flp pilus assembly pilin Flp